MVYFNVNLIYNFINLTLTGSLGLVLLLSSELEVGFVGTNWGQLKSMLHSSLLRTG